MPIVRTRFVSNHNSVGFAHKKAQTISFVERGFERLGLSHQAISLLPMFIHSKVIFALRIFLQEAGWEALVFGHFSQPPLWITCFSFYTSLCFFILRPRVGSTFQDWYLSHQPIPGVVGDGWKSWRVWLCQVQSIEWQ